MKGQSESVPMIYGAVLGCVDGGLMGSTIGSYFGQYIQLPTLGGIIGGYFGALAGVFVGVTGTDLEYWGLMDLWRTFLSSKHFCVAILWREQTFLNDSNSLY